MGVRRKTGVEFSIFDETSKTLRINREKLEGKCILSIEKNVSKSYVVIEKKKKNFFIERFRVHRVNDQLFMPDDPFLTLVQIVKFCKLSINVGSVWIIANIECFFLETFY